MTLFYNIGILFLGLGIRISALWNKKSKQWISGRRGLLGRLKQHELQGCIWFHCASLGEFEQARPLLETIKEQYPDKKVLVTFFSPSGYEIRKNYERANHVDYILLDSPNNAKRFTSIVQPSVAIFVKYELWYHHLKQLKQRNTPVFLLSASFRPNHRYFKWYGGFFRRMLQELDHIFVQDSRSMDLLKGIDIAHLTLSGDTRFDRVSQLAQKASADDKVAAFAVSGPVVIGGSTWEQEEIILAEALLIDPSLRLIIAPHDVSENRLKGIENQFKGRLVRYSNLSDETDANVLLIDSVGLLGNLYQYGDVALVGGGFTGALHNILEPVAHGLTVCFGPKHDRFPEAEMLISHGGGHVTSTVSDLIEIVSTVRQNPNSKEKNRAFVAENQGATAKVLAHLAPILK